jgi:hypothetical protein
MKLLRAHELRLHLPTRRAFEWWKIREPALAGHDDFASLVAEIQDPATSLEREDARLAALVRLSRYDDAAVVALLVLLAPRLAAKVRRFAAALPRDEAEAEIVAGLVDRVRRYDLGRRPSKVAANLVWDACRPLRRARDRHRAWTEATVPLGGTDTAHPRHTNGAAVDLAEDAILDLAVTARVITRPDAALIAATRLRGFTLADATRLVGLGYEAAAKRRQRAEAALAAWWTARAPEAA